MDFGALFQGYASDMTRTVLIEPTNKWKHLSLFKEYYSLLKAIQQLCIAELRIGMSGEDMHNTATKELKKIKLDTYFIHSLGHGVGLQIHENPRLSASSAHILQENMVVTVEPGIYLPGKFGIRIEDTVLITKKGAKQLTKSTKNLSSLHIK